MNSHFSTYRHHFKIPLFKTKHVNALFLISAYSYISLFSIITFFLHFEPLSATSSTVSNVSPLLPSSTNEPSSTESIRQCPTDIVKAARTNFNSCSRCTTTSDESTSAEDLKPCPIPCCTHQLILGRHTNHFQWCTNGCCHRVISRIIGDSSTDQDRKNRLATQAIVVNDIPFDSKDTDEVCASTDMNNTCGQRCAAPLLPGKRCASDMVTVTNLEYDLEVDPCSSPSENEEETSDNEASSNDEDSDADSSNSPPCFPASASVQLLDGRRRRMDQLFVGDMVLCNSHQKYSPVIGFSHADKSLMTPLRRVTLDSEDILSATHGHYVYKQSRSNNVNLVRMDEISIGDFMILGNGTISRVVRIEEAVERGLYNPQTSCGDVVVNGVVVSAYTAAIKPSTAHALMVPVRVAASVEWSKAIAAFLIEKSAHVGRQIGQKMQCCSLINMGCL